MFCSENLTAETRAEDIRLGFASLCRSAYRSIVAGLLTKENTLRNLRIPLSICRTFFSVALFSSLPLAFSVVGCGGNLTGIPNSAPIVTIVANPTAITSGKPSTLTVIATNATQVTVTGTDGSTYTLQANGGTQAVNPTATTTYTAAATGVGGKDSASATVTVPSNQSPTVTITADPTAISLGNPSTLTVIATNATLVTITGTDGSTYSLTASGGTQAVSPTATTTYTAAASGTNGKASATATVTVTSNPVPTVSISTYPTSITSGSSSILTVTAVYATQVILTGTDGSKYTLQASGGTQAVSPTATTIYTAVGTGAGKTASAAATLTVTPNPAPTVTITGTPASITSGSSSTLTVTAVFATQVTVTGSDGTMYPLPSSGGLQLVSPATTTTYTAAATGAGGNTSASTTVTVTANPAPSVSISANPTSIVLGNSSILTVTVANATLLTLTGTDGNTYSLPASDGTQLVNPTVTSTYTASATGPGGTALASVTVAVTSAGGVQSIDHVIFMLQENHSFDNYLGMLNPYREHPNGPGMPCPLNASGVPQCWNIGDDGVTYNVDGIDDKLKTISNEDDEGATFYPFKFTSTCMDDDSSDWLASYGSVNRYDFTTTRPILMDGFVHTAEGYAKSCSPTGSGGSTCSGTFSLQSQTGQPAMGYYDEGFLNYYYYMASQFAVSDRWFSPVATKSIGNRIATFTGGTTQGLVKDPGGDDHLSQLAISNIFEALEKAGVSWKIYYTVTQGLCLSDDDCPTGPNTEYPATYFSNLSYSINYLYDNPKADKCAFPTVGSSVVGDGGDSFCIDPSHIAPIFPDYFTDVANGTLPSFAFIEAGYGNNDEHPGSGQSILEGQAQVASVVKALMNSPSWKDSVFFFSYDEGGGPYDHVPPVPGHSNDYTNTTTLGAVPPDIGGIGGIAVNPDATSGDPTLYFPCVPAAPGTPTLHCDLASKDPGANSDDAAALHGFAAQLGFRLPNIIISPFTKKHYVSHTPMDHTAVIKFVEDRFIGNHKYLTNRDAAQPNLLEFFDFTGIPWATPPTPPTPLAPPGNCNTINVGP